MKLVWVKVERQLLYPVPLRLHIRERDNRASIVVLTNSKSGMSYFFCKWEKLCIIVQKNEIGSNGAGTHCRKSSKAYPFGHEGCVRRCLVKPLLIPEIYRWSNRNFGVPIKWIGWLGEWFLPQSKTNTSPLQSINQCQLHVNYNAMQNRTLEMGRAKISNTSKTTKTQKMNSVQLHFVL